VNIYRDEVEVNIHRWLTEPEANDCFGIIFRGEYQELQNNRLKQGTTDAKKKNRKKKPSETNIRIRLK